MTSFLFSPDYWAVLDDLFMRLPVRDLLYGCRGACEQWNQRICETRRGQMVLQRRANLLHAICKQSPIHRDAYAAIFPTKTGNIDNNDAATEEEKEEAIEPHQQCMMLIWLLHKHWHEQVVMQSYRRTCLGELPKVASLFQNRIDSKDSFAELDEKKDAIIHIETAAQTLERAQMFLQFLEEAANGLEKRVLEDENDLLVERASRIVPNAHEKNED